MNNLDRAMARVDLYAIVEECGFRDPPVGSDGRAFVTDLTVSLVSRARRNPMLLRSRDRDGFLADVAAAAMPNDKTAAWAVAEDLRVDRLHLEEAGRVLAGAILDALVAFVIVGDDDFDEGGWE